MEEKKILAVKDVFCRVKQFYYGVSDKRAALYVADTGRTAEYTKALRDLRGIFTPAEQQGEAAGYLLACAEQIEEAFAERNFRLAGDLAEAGIRLCSVFDFPYFSRKRFYETVVSPLEERHGVSFFADGGKAFLAGKDKRIALRPVFTQRERHLHYSEENTDADFELAHPWLYRLFLVLGLLVFVLFLPLAAIVSSLLMGLHRSWNRSTWLFPLIPAAGHMLADYLTFKLANSISHHKCNLPDWNLLIPGLVCAVIGLLIGIAVARISK